MPFGPIIRAMRHNRMRFAFIILEIAMTLAIVTNAVNMILDERQKMLQKSGFDDDNLVSVAYQPFAPEFKEESYVEALVQKDMRAMNLPSSRPMRFREQTMRKSTDTMASDRICGGTTPSSLMTSGIEVTSVCKGRPKRPCFFWSMT